MWNVAKATSAAKFKKLIQKMKEKEVNAYKWLMNVDPFHQFTYAFNLRPKYDKLLNNISQSFNLVIRDFREKPILTLLEEVVTYNMHLIHRNRDLMLKYHEPIIPKAQAKLEKEKLQSGVWIPH